MPASQIALELWCWMEPSNSSRGEALGDGDSAATDSLLNKLGARGDEPRVKVLAMLHADGAVVVTDEQAPGCIDGQASRPVAEL